MWARAMRVRSPVLRPLVGPAALRAGPGTRFFATPTPERLASLALVFEKWDVDRSATLDLLEIKAGLKELEVPHSDATIAKIFLGLVSHDEYDDEIPMEEKVVTLTEWFDNLPDKLADEIISRSAVKLLLGKDAPRIWRPYVQKSIDERVSSQDSQTTTTLSPLINAFREWDKDNSKTLDLEEIKSGLAALGISHDTRAVEKLFQSLCASVESDSMTNAIDLDQKVVRIADWLDNCPSDLKTAIYEAQARKGQFRKQQQ